MRANSCPSTSFTLIPSSDLMNDLLRAQGISQEEIDRLAQRKVPRR